MSDFQTLLAAALVGTSRSTTPTHSGSQMAAELNKLEGRDPEGLLLARAALAGLMEKAGRSASTSKVEVPECAPAETLPEAPACFARHLLTTKGTPLFREWLDLCAEAGWRIPNQDLPEVLDWIGQYSRLRKVARPVLGQRAAWLAQFQHDWRFTPQAFSEETWQEATEAQKKALFEDFRETEPEQAQAFLRENMKSERAKTRKNMLEVLEKTWSEADAGLESYLEELLLDKSKDVREVVRQILRNIPQSAYNQRMARRLSVALSVENTGLLGKLTGKKKASLSAPDTEDSDLKRDGIPEKNGKIDVSLTEYLECLVAGTHPQVMEEALNCNSQQLLDILKKMHVEQALLLNVLSTKYTPLANLLWTEDGKWSSLTAVASKEQIKKRVYQELGNKNILKVAGILQASEEIIDKDLSHQLVFILIEEIEKSLRRRQNRKDNRYQSADYEVYSLMSGVAPYLHPSVQGKYTFPETDIDYDAKAIQNFEITIQQRAQMHQDYQAALKEASA